MLGKTKADNPLIRRIFVKHGDWDNSDFVFTGQPDSEIRIGLIADGTVIGQLEVSSTAWSDAEI